MREAIVQSRVPSWRAQEGTRALGRRGLRALAIGLALCLPSLAAAQEGPSAPELPPEPTPVPAVAPTHATPVHDISEAALATESAITGGDEPELSVPATPSVAVEGEVAAEQAPTPQVDPSMVSEEMAAEAGAGADEASDPPWYEHLSIGAFADAYFAGHWTLPNPVQGDRTDIIGHRAYDATGGLNLAFLGLDVQFEDGPVGATASLRFGSAVPRLLGAFSGLPEGMQFLTQAYVTWRPVEQLSIDFGEFNTIYGGEVAESWQNPTYTRGALYNVIQPFYHAGFRVAWAPTDEATLTLLVVNGWNNVLDDNDGKTVGAQFAWGSGPFSFSIGYLTGPEGAGNDERFRHLIDAVATLDLGVIAFFANADFVTEDQGDGTYQSNGGGMLAAHIPIGDYFGLGMRGEYIHDGAVDQGLGTATLTLEALPTDTMVIRLDTRVDIATDDRFIDASSAPSPLAVSSVLGAVVHTN